MLFGYEQELFTFSNGRVTPCAVNRGLRDKQRWFSRGYLAEARGCPSSNPETSLLSYLAALSQLKRLVENNNQTLFLAAELPTEKGLIQAGFHVHFGVKEVNEATRFVEALETHFKPLIQQYGRDTNPKLANEKKYWGFEYRRLPATVNPEEVTRILKAQLK